MPPPQPLLASRIRCFICRSCLSKFQASQPRRLQWQIRNFTNNNGPSKTGYGTRTVPRAQRKGLPEPVIRYFEETPDGDRREIRDEDEEDAEEVAEDDAFIESLESTIRNLEERVGKRTSPLENSDFGKVEVQDDSGGHEWRSHDGSDGDTLPENIDTKIDELQAHIERLKSVSQFQNLSEEVRLKIREELLNFDTDADLSPSSTEIPLEPAHNTLVPAARTDILVKQDQTTTPDLESKVIQTPVESYPAIEIPLEAYPSRVRKRLLSLNKYLVRASRMGEGRMVLEFRRNAWKSYVLCRKELLSRPEIVPAGVWYVLWAIFARRDALILHQMPRIKMLGRDMIEAGIPMNDLQRLSYIEATFMESNFARDLAIQQWLDARTEILRAPSKAVFKDYWRLGVKMFCEVGNPDLALRIAESLLKDTGDLEDFRILLPVIRTCLESPHHKIEMAWELYSRLKLNLGDQMTMEDYDVVAILFLNANESDLALGIFKDMMLTGDTSVAQEALKFPYESAAGTEGVLIRANNDGGKVGWQKSRILTTLPPKFNNKYFFGSWLKKLIGEQQLDAAKKVLDLMHERAICPDSKHVNGLIGAWFRERSLRSRQLAEDMAWRMIKARSEFVKRRDMRHDLKWPLRPLESEAKSDNKPVSLTPNATIETFSILIQYYRQAQKEELSIELFNMLKTCKILPDTFFLNQLILIDSRSPKMPWAWDIYVLYVRHNGILPDFDTYSYLWQLMVKAVDTNTYRYDHFLKRRFTTPRKLFAEMASRVRLLTKEEAIPKGLYESIILSFGLGCDHAGTAVALHSLKRDFGMFPSEDTVRSIVLALARGDQKTPGSRRVDLTDTSQERIREIAQRLQTLKNQRVDNLLQQGIIFENLPQDEKLEETLLLLSRLLQSAAASQLKTEGSETTELSLVAAEEMGVPDCVPWTADMVVY